jgi:hypothetical protein
MFLFLLGVPDMKEVENLMMTHDDASQDSVFEAYTRAMPSERHENYFLKREQTAGEIVRNHIFKTPSDLLSKVVGCDDCIGK